MKRMILFLATLLLALSAPAQESSDLEFIAPKLAQELESALAQLRQMGDELLAEKGEGMSLEGRVPQEGPLRGLGIQCIKEGEALAWAGWSFPPEQELPGGAEAPRLSLRSYGVFRILSLSLTAADGSLWLLDLPLLRTDGAEGPGPATLWKGGLGILPMEGGTLLLSVDEPWTVDFQMDEGGALLGLSGQRFARLYRLPDTQLSLRGEAAREPLWVALPLLILGLLILFRPGIPQALKFAGTAAGLLGGALLLRGALSLANFRGDIFDPRAFSLPGFGGLLTSPGDLLLSGLILFVALFLLRRLEPKRTGVGRSPLAVAMAFLIPLAILAAGYWVTELVLSNSSSTLLFEGLLPSATGVALYLGIFFVQLTLLLLLLPEARRAWRALTLPTKLSVLLALVLSSALIWQSAFMFMAALALALAAWVPSTSRSRAAGMIWLLLPLVISMVFLSQDVQENSQDHYLAALINQESETGGSMGRHLLLRRVLGEISGDRELRSILASGQKPEPGFAMSLWSRSQLSSLAGPGAFAIYDPRGALRSFHQVGDAPAHPDLLPPHGRGRDIRIREITGPGGQIFLRGETALLDPLGNLGALVLDLPREHAPLPRPASLRERGLPARLMAVLSRNSLYLAAVALLVLLDLLLAATGITPREGKRRGLEFGFQARLLGSFLLVALLPTALIGVLGAREVLRQLEDGSERAAIQRVQAARSLLESQVRQEAQDLVRSEYVKSFVVDDPMFEQAPRDIGAQARNQIMIFDGQGAIRLDESLRDWGQAEVDSFLTVLPRDQVIYERSGRDLFAGILLDPLIRHRGARVPMLVFYRMKVGADLVAGLAEGIGGDLSLYGGGDLLHSNRVEPFGLGWIPPRLRMSSVERLASSRNESRPLSERGEDERFQRALLTLPGVGGAPVGVLSSQNPAGREDRRLAMRQATGQVFALASLLLLMALSLGGWLSRRIFEPIQRLQLGTRSVAAGDFTERLAESGGDEIGELVSSFNRMTDRLEEAQREVVRKKRLEAWSEMARQVAHEIKNPLTPIKLSVQHMERAWRDKKPNFDVIFNDTVTTLYEQVEILRRIARDFSSFGRGQKLVIASVDLPELAAEVVAPYAGAALKVDMPEIESLLVRADREALRKIILNLVENAREAMDEGGRLELNWRRVEQGVELSLRDHGPGIPEELRDKLFEPYFSTKTSGTGLGLAICAQLSEEMGGQLRIENHPEGGAISLLRLPEAIDV